jgi:hypothetical protein
MTPGYRPKRHPVSDGVRRTDTKILALGAARRHRYIDWAGVRIRWGARWGRDGMEFRTSPAAAVALALIPFVMLLLGVLAAVCGKR